MIGRVIDHKNSIQIQYFKINQFCSHDCHPPALPVSIECFFHVTLDVIKNIMLLLLCVEVLDFLTVNMNKSVIRASR